MTEASSLMVVTNSMDGTSDTLMRLAAGRGLRVFRVNTDLLGQYQISVRAGDFEVQDPTGRTVRMRDLQACYMRKPWVNGAEPWLEFPETERTWVKGQFHRLVRELLNLCRLKGILRLVEPDAERRLDKLTQMEVARRYFDVPAWEYLLNRRAEPGQRVTKPLAPEVVETPWRRFVFTEVVEASHLDPKYPWLIQDKAEGQFDSTVVFIAGQCHGFRIVRGRDTGPTDWRENILSETPDQWRRYDLPNAVVEGCRQFMRDVGLLYGRFDFIADDTGRHWFLEVNSNGQYGWLDEGDERQPLHNAVLDAVLDPANTIPFLGHPTAHR